MPGRMSIALPLGALNAATMKLISCRFKSAPQTSRLQRFIAAQSALNNGTTIRKRNNLMNHPQTSCT